MKVLLLGVTGNVGSRLLPALLSHNHTVVVYVRNEAKLRNLVPHSLLADITLVAGDATDSATLTKALVENKCDAIINSAGLASAFPWQAPAMQEIEKAVTNAAVAASQQLGYAIRGWFLGGMTALDVPGLKNTQLVH